jgi:hypothetical protein
MKRYQSSAKAALFTLLLIGLLAAGLFLQAGVQQAPAGQETVLLEAAEEVLSEVSRIRELEIKSPIAKGVKSRDEIRAYLISRIEKEYPKEEIQREELLMKKLRLIPEDMDLEAFVLDLLTEQVAGYYSPETSTFYIAAWIPLELQKPVMAHELTHALQDQHFDLSALTQRIRGNDDLMLARNAVLEGDALAVMFDYLLQPLGRSFLDLPDLAQLAQFQFQAGGDQYRALGAAPDYLKESLLFPYIQGASFIQAYRRLHSWPEVNKVYSDMPRSSEQIMHPEKYLGTRDDPQAVPESDSFPGSERLVSNVLGEFTTYHVLKQFVPEASARRASEGWGGDRVELFQLADGTWALVLTSVWDSAADAREFFEAYRDLTTRKYPGGTETGNLEGPEPIEVEWMASGHDVRLRLEGKQVLIVERATPSAPRR